MEINVEKTKTIRISRQPTPEGRNNTTECD
jgi:hypothetical protein